ncbi:hypothetical protein DV096_04085 [Bradymonadaceae bacterium TMQ3]|nr:hypothetical protein DV096_04085 [Bradymonadaceae bacterium TMQ3]TXC77504.1 hypothetical protein FRC91_01850 [Bradymonadales bacterium TMQ1]
MPTLVKVFARNGSGTSARYVCQRSDVISGEEEDIEICDHKLLAELILSSGHYVMTEIDLGGGEILAEDLLIEIKSPNPETKKDNLDALPEFDEETKEIRIRGNT